MFSLKQPKPTFKSYLLPLPQAEDHIASEPRIKKLEPVLLPVDTHPRSLTHKEVTACSSLRHSTENARQCEIAFLKM